MSVLLTWTKGSAEVTAAFDAIVTETHSRSAQVTAHPVEQGADVADHVYVDPLRLTLEALVTNTPLRTPTTQNRNSSGEVRALDDVQANTLQFDASMDRPKDVYEDLRDAFANKSAITVDTALERYQDMVIIGLSVPREAGSGLDTQSGTRVDKLTFSIEMQQIRVVGSRTGEVRQPKAGAPKKKKQKGTKEKKEATELESAAHQAFY